MKSRKLHLDNPTVYMRSETPLWLILHPSPQHWIENWFFKDLIDDYFVIAQAWLLCYKTQEYLYPKQKIVTAQNPGIYLSHLIRTFNLI